MQMASNRVEGALTATPDVCLTPVGAVPVPIPYFNTAFTSTAVSFVPNMVVCGGNALNLGTVLAASTGDEPGVLNWTIAGRSRASSPAAPRSSSPACPPSASRTSGRRTRATRRAAR